MTRLKVSPEQETNHRARSELVIRLSAALVLAVFALAATTYSAWSFLILIIVASGIIAWEWGRLTRGDGFDAISLISMIATPAIAGFLLWERPAISFAAFIAAALAVAFRHTDRADWSLAGLTYASLPAAALVWLRADPGLGAIAVLYLFAVAWTTDTISYAAGHLIGGPKLAPRISPQKTWSGFLIGAATPALVGIGFAEVLGAGSALKLALASVALALACQMGDLFESWVKRRFGAKDMSHLIPGHGGLLDRIDGLLFAAILAGLIALRDPAHPARGLLIW